MHARHHCFALFGRSLRDFGVAVHDSKDIQQLALVFVYAFDLHVEQGVGIDADIHRTVQPFRKRLLVRLLGRAPTLSKLRILRHRLDRLESLEIVYPPRADHARVNARERWIRLQQPSSRRDTIRHVDELFWPHQQKVGE